MSGGRMSPAASLLRNSKLFALPPTVALPASNPSSEPVPRSDTATNPYPIHAAIETPLLSLSRGDWGFKRALPLKSTTRSGTSVVRLNKGIDTAEHIADFDSASDHVLTLRKFQELNQALQMPTGDLRADGTMKRESAFSATSDSTIGGSQSTTKTKYTGVWPNIDPAEGQTVSELSDQSGDAIKVFPEQSATSTRTRNLRWRFEGPSLVQLSGLEFDRYLQSLDATKRAAFLEKAKESLQREVAEKAQAAAREAGTVGETTPAPVTSADVAQYIKRLRQQPEKFGPLIAEFLDLPEGPERGSSFELSRWEYGRQTVSSEYYRKAGLPRTHPSAGLSYIHSKSFALNNAVLGPQRERLPAVARAVKTKSKQSARNSANYGLAGFVINSPRANSVRSALDIPTFEPTPGGLKEPVVPVEAEISEKGTLQMSAKPAPGYKIRDNIAVHHSMLPTDEITSRFQSSTLKHNQRRVFNSVTSNSVNGMDYQRRTPLKQDQDMDSLLEDFMRSTRETKSTS